MKLEPLTNEQAAIVNRVYDALMPMIESDAIDAATKGGLCGPLERIMVCIGKLREGLTQASDENKSLSNRVKELERQLADATANKPA